MVARLTPEAVVLENQVCRYAIGRDGTNRSFVSLKGGKDVCEPGRPFMQVGRGSQTWPSSAVAMEGEVLVVSFGDAGVQVRVRPEIRPRYFTLTVERVSGAPVDWVQLCNLHLTITQNVGPLVNAAWDERFAACVLACNDRTDSQGADASRATLTARCYREYGLEGAKVAILGVPTGPPSPADRLLDAIEQVEIEQGLPHPTLNGVWIKRAPERFASYLMVHDLGEQNVDQVIRFARGGFGCIEIYPWRSTPSYALNPGLFPGGLPGLKRVADKIHAAGLQLGLHSMQGMVGWGAKDDPYLTPKADPRLRQDRHATLAAPLPAQATEIAVREDTEGWPDQGDLYLEGEIVRYSGRSKQAFTGCQRGLYGTTVSAHPEGARVGHLVNCFPLWGNAVYAPDVDSTMIDEVCERMAYLFNETGADMSYFDGGEEIAVQPPWWRNQGRIALGVMRRLKKPVILEGNALYTHLSWHVITRGSPSFDPIYFGRREYTLRAKGQNPASWAKNLLTGDVGWFNPHVWSPSTDAVTPEEVMLLCLKALAGKAPISFQVSAANLWANKRMPEMLEIIRTCDELKRRDTFDEAVRAELARPMAEHVLERGPDGRWGVSPMQFGPPSVLNANAAERSALTFTNPYGQQAPWIRIRARARLAPYGSAENVVLANPEREVPFRVDSTASAQLVQSVEASEERAPDGTPAFCYRAENRGAGPSSWYKLTRSFPQPLNLVGHRRLGVWVRAEAQGGILNVQLAEQYGYRDHYIVLDYTGWRYHELDPPEDTRFWQFGWPYSFIDLMYWPFRYHEVRGINLWLNALPAGTSAACWVGRVEALREETGPLRSPALECDGQRLRFPVSLQPEEYLEVDWAGRCRHFERNGGLIQEVTPEGNLQLAPGEHTIRFTCESSANVSARAEIALAVKGKPLLGRGRPGRAPRAGQAERVHLEPGAAGAFRVLYGPYELAGDGPPHTIAAYDGQANTWTVENPTGRPCPSAILITRPHAAPDVDYRDPAAIPLEDFSDLGAYELSAANPFEQFVVGGGKEITPEGPVRAGVSQQLVATTEGARPGGGRYALYSAVNRGEAGGWCAKGKRFARPLDLSRHAAIAFWLRGDGQGETLRFQLRDRAGKAADWLVRLDFAGWRLQIFRTADVADFDWRAVEYLLFYFNDIPAGARCTMGLESVKALPRLRKPLALRNPVLVVGGQRLRLPVEVRAGDAVLVDGHTRVTVWRAGADRGRSLRVEGRPLLLQPGATRVELWATEPALQGRGADVALPPADVSVRVFRLGPVKEQR